MRPFLGFTLSFGKFWQALQKKFTDDRKRAFAEASAYAQGYGAMRRGHRNARARWRFQRVVNRLAILQGFKGYLPLWSQK
jgi:hypothetical protein